MNKNVIQGSLLGNGYLEKGQKSKNARFKFKQNSKRISYVEYVSSCLGDLTNGKILICKNRKPSKVNGKIDHSIEKWNGDFCESAVIWSHSSRHFTELYDSWYSLGKKIIPSNLVLNAEMLAHWFVQNGSNNININAKSKSILFTNNTLNSDECEFLVNQLANMGFKSKTYYLSKGPNIKVMAESYFDFMKLVTPYVIKFDCFDYKIDTSLAPNDRIGKKWNGPKLNLTIAKKIRQLFWETKPKLKDLAEMFDVSPSTIGKIINNQMYNKSDLNFFGSAEVKVSYGN